MGTLPAGAYIIGPDDEEEEARRRAAAAGIASKPSSSLPPGAVIIEDEPEGLPEPPDFLSRLGEYGRAINRGTANTLEFGLDIMDVPIQAGKAAVEANLSGAESPLKAALAAAKEQVNIFGEDSEIDKLRQEHLWDNVPELLTEKKYDDPIATGLQWGQEALAGGGRAALRPILGAVGSGTGAAIGEEVGGEAGKMIGGLTGGFTSPSLAAMAEDGGNVPIAYRVIRESAEKPDQALATIKRNLAEGKRGSIAGLSEDLGIHNLEASLPKGSPEYKAVFGQVQEGQIQQLDEVLEAFGDGNIAAGRKGAQDLVDARLAEIGETEQLQRNVLAADTAAEMDVVDTGLAQTRKAMADQEAAAAAVVYPDAPQASEDLATAYNQLDETLDTNLVKPAWAQFDNATAPMDGSAAQKVKDDFLQTLDGTMGRMVKGKHANTMKLINGWKGRAIRPSEIQTVISDIKSIHRAESITGAVSPATNKLKSLQKQLEKHLETSVTPATSAAYKQAIDASTEYYNRVKPNIVAKGRNKPTPEELGRSVFVPGDRGRAAAQQLKQSGDQPVIDAVKQYVRSQGDSVNPAFMKKYDAFLNEFPDLKTEMQGIVEGDTVLTKAKQALSDAERAGVKTKRALEKTLESNQKNIAAEATGLRTALAKQNVSKFAENPKEAVASILDGPNPSGDLAALAKSVDDKSLVRTVGEVVKDRLGRDLLGTTKKGLNAESINKWGALKDDIEKFDPALAKQVETAVNRAHTDVLRRMSAAERTKAINSMGGELAINFMSAAIAGMLPGTHTLMYGGRIRQMLNAVFGMKRKHEKAVMDLLTDPKRLMAMTEKFGDEKNWSRMPMVVRTAIIEGNEDE